MKRFWLAFLIAVSSTFAADKTLPELSDIDLDHFFTEHTHATNDTAKTTKEITGFLDVAPVGNVRFVGRVDHSFIAEVTLSASVDTAPSVDTTAYHIHIADFIMQISVPLFLGPPPASNAPHEEKERYNDLLHNAKVEVIRSLLHFEEIGAPLHNLPPHFRIEEIHPGDTGISLDTKRFLDQLLSGGKNANKPKFGSGSMVYLAVDDFSLKVENIEIISEDGKHEAERLLLPVTGNAKLLRSLEKEDPMLQIQAIESIVGQLNKTLEEHTEIPAGEQREIALVAHQLEMKLTEIFNEWTGRNSIELQNAKRQIERIILRLDGRFDNEKTLATTQLEISFVVDQLRQKFAELRVESLSTNTPELQSLNQLIERSKKLIGEGGGDEIQTIEPKAPLWLDGKKLVPEQDWDNDATLERLEKMYKLLRTITVKALGSVCEEQLTETSGVRPKPSRPPAVRRRSTGNFAIPDGVFDRDFF